MTAKTVDFSKALSELTAIVEQIEGGQLNLEESLQQFEKGVALIRQCQQVLNDAEQKVEILLQQKKGDDSTQNLEPFHHEKNS